MLWVLSDIFVKETGPWIFDVHGSIIEKNICVYKLIIEEQLLLGSCIDRNRTGGWTQLHDAGVTHTRTQKSKCLQVFLPMIYYWSVATFANRKILLSGVTDMYTDGWEQQFLLCLSHIFIILSLFVTVEKKTSSIWPSLNQCVRLHCVKVSCCFAAYNPLRQKLTSVLEPALWLRWWSTTYLSTLKGNAVPRMSKVTLLSTSVSLPP